MTQPNPVLIIGGPTASGKSQLALEYAKANNGIIINADSMQVYKELPTLTAQPSDSDMALVPHKLYGVLAGDDTCSVARWQRMALQELTKAWQQDKLPIVVGGTGLYLQSLLTGISDIPDIDPAIRRQAKTLHQELGSEAFHSRLQAMDPATAVKLHPGDTQRMIRAYEVIQSTGKSIADWQKQKNTSAIAKLDCTVKLIMPPKEELHRKANERLAKMINNGALKEVQNLLNKNYAPNLPVMKALGVTELSAHLQGKITLPEAIELIQIATRQYIKRQITWFKNQ